MSSKNYLSKRQRQLKSLMPGISVVLIMLAAFFSSVLAENSPPERVFPKRVYLGIGGGITDLDPESRTPALTVGEDQSSGFTLFLGYDVSKYFSVEGYYSSLGDAGIRFLGDDVGSIDYDVFGISAVGYLFNLRGSGHYESGYSDEGRFRREGLSGYLKLGLGAMSNDSGGLNYDRDHTAHLSAGVGLEYGWSNGFALRAELASFDTDAHYAGLSILKRFGAAPAFVPAGTSLQSQQPEPEPPMSAATQGKESLLRDPGSTYFAFGKYELSDSTIVELMKVADMANSREAVQMKVNGHTDSVGSESFNQVLSVKRAEAVRQFLLFEGVDPSRIEIQGHGELSPIATNETAEGRARNRRVEINLQ